MGTFSNNNIIVKQQLNVGATSSLHLVDMQVNKVINLATGSNPLDAVNVGQLSLATASLVTTTQLSAATASAYSYTNTQIASATASTYIYINSQIASATSSLVTTSQLASATNSAYNYTNTQIASATNSTYTYVNTQIASATASLIKLTNLGIINSIAYFDTTNSLTASSNLQFQTFDAANNGRGIYINDTTSSHFVLGCYNITNGVTIINTIGNANGSKTVFRFANGADIFGVYNISSQYYTLSNTTGMRVGDTTTPTARLHITNGGITANTAPLKLTGTSSNLLSTLENGAIEFDGTSLYWTGTFSGGPNRYKVLGQTGSNAANSIAYFNDTNSVKTNSNFTYNGTDLNLGTGANYIRVAGAPVIGGSTTIGTQIYPISLNQVMFGDQQNGNPNVINMYLNSTSSFGMAIGRGGAQATARLQLMGASGSNMAPLKLTATSSNPLLTVTEAGAIENDGNHLYYTATASGTRYQLDRQGVSNYAHTIFTPTTGNTVNLVNNQYNIINPVGALLALTLNLPSSPLNNDCVYIKFTQNVTTVTYANGTVVDGITAPSAGGLTIFVYDSTNTSWY